MQGGNNNSVSCRATTQGFAATAAGLTGGVSAATASSSNGVAVCLLTDDTKSNINACLEVFDKARRELDERNWGFAAKDAEFDNTARGVALATVTVGQLACSVALQFPQLLSDVSDASPKAMANTSDASRDSTQNSQLLNIKDFLANIQSLNKAITDNFARPDAGEPAGERVETGFANMHGEAHANIVSASANLSMLGSGLVVFPEAAALLTDMARYTVNEVSQIGALGTDAVSELSPLLTKISQAKDIQAKLKSINDLIDKMNRFLSEDHNTDVTEKLSVDTKKQQATGAAVAKTAGVSAVLTLAASLKTISQALLAGHILSEARGSCVTDPDITTQGSNVDKDESVVTRGMQEKTNANIQGQLNKLDDMDLRGEDEYAVVATVNAAGVVAKGSAAVVGSATAVSAVPSQQFQMTGLSSSVSSHVVRNAKYRVDSSDDASKLEANHSAVISAWSEVLDKTTKQIKARLEAEYQGMAGHHKSTIGTEAGSLPVTAMLVVPVLATIIHQVSAIATRESLGGTQASKLSHEESINPDNSEKSKTKQTGQCLDAALARSIGEFTKQLDLARDKGVITPVICGLLGRIVVTGISLAVADAASTAVSMSQQTGLHTTDVTQRLGNATNKSMALDQPDEDQDVDNVAENQEPLLAEGNPEGDVDENDFDAEGRLKERLASAPDSTAKTSPGLAPDQGEITAGNNCTRETILYILRSENAASEQLGKSHQKHDRDGGFDLNASAIILDNWLKTSIATGSVGLTLGGGVGGATLLSGTVFSSTVALNAAAIMLKNAVAKVCNPEHAVHQGPDRCVSVNGSDTDTNPSASMNASRIGTHHSSNGNPDTLSAALVTPQLLEVFSLRFATVIISQNQALSNLVTDECKDAKGLDESLKLAIRSVNEECSEQLTDNIKEALLAEDGKPAAEAEEEAKKLEPFYNKLIGDMALQLGSSAVPSIASFVLSNVAMIMPLAIAWHRCKAGYADSQVQKDERLSGVSGFDSVSKISNIMQNFTRVAAELDYRELDNLEKNQNSIHAATHTIHTGSEAASSIALQETRLSAELLEMSISRSMTLLDYQAIVQSGCNLSVKLKDVSSQLVSLVALQVENDTAQANPESSEGAGSQTIGSISALRSTVTRLVNASNELSLQLFHLQTELQKAALDTEKLQGCNGTRNGNDEKLHTVQTAMMRAASALTLLASQSITALPMLLSLPVNSSLATMKKGPLAKIDQKSKQESASVRYQGDMILAPSTQEESAQDDSCAETGSVTRPVVSIIDPMLITAVNVLVTLTKSASNVVHQASNSLVSVVDVLSAQNPIDDSTRQTQKVDFKKDSEKSTYASIIPPLVAVGEGIRQTENDDSACLQATTRMLRALGEKVDRRRYAALEGLGDLGPEPDEVKIGGDLTKFGYMQHIIAALSGMQADCVEVKQHAQRLNRGGLKLSQFHSMFNSDHGQGSSTVLEPIKQLQRLDTAENLISHFVSVVVSEFATDQSSATLTDKSSATLEELKSGIARQGASLDVNAEKMHNSILEKIFAKLRIANLADRFGPALDNKKFMQIHKVVTNTVPSADAVLGYDYNKPSAPPLPFFEGEESQFDTLMQGFDDLMDIAVALPAEGDLAGQKEPMAQGFSEPSSVDEEDSFDTGLIARAGMFKDELGYHSSDDLNDEPGYRSSDNSPTMVLGALPPTPPPSQSK